MKNYVLHALVKRVWYKISLL